MTVSPEFVGCYILALTWSSILAHLAAPLNGTPPPTN